MIPNSSSNGANCLDIVEIDSNRIAITETDEAMNHGAVVTTSRENLAKLVQSIKDGQYDFMLPQEAVTA